MNLQEKSIIYLSGEVVSKRKDKRYYGRFREFYELEVIVAGKPEIKIMEANQILLPEEVGESILNNSFFRKKYVFSCIKHGRTYRLVNWQEIND